MKDGLIKVGSALPILRLADVGGNLESCIKAAEDAARLGVNVLGFPELTLTGASCADLYGQSLLIRSSENAVSDYIERTKDLDILTAIGTPVRYMDRLYNCAAVIFRGELLGLVTKTYIGKSAGECMFSTPSFGCVKIKYAGKETFLGTRMIFCSENIPELRISYEIGADVFAPIAPSCDHTGAGASLIINLSSDAEAVGRADIRRTVISAHSYKTRCAYVYTNGGAGESTTDAVFSSHCIIAECGKIIAEAEPFSDKCLLVTEIDTQLVSCEKRSVGSDPLTGYTYIPFSMRERKTELTRRIEKSPFVGESVAEGGRACDLIFEIQARGLAERMARSGSKKMVIGVSGGLDSTLALLVCARAADILSIDRKNIIGVTMPCFGTTSRTRSNAERLSEALGAEFRTVDIKDSVMTHFRNIGHDGIATDVTFENSQARERTQVLMDMANMENGLVVGTGDLSELVLGWATYNGDHMSMYAVNSSLSKTQVRAVVEGYAEGCRAKGEYRTAEILDDILATPVSPELLPPKDGEISQCTEELVGPYELHDFFIYYTLKYGFEPEKILRLAGYAFEGKYDGEVILGWLRVFARRFLTQQFKRSCMPDGPKTADISVSPRTDLHMPSDASFLEWMRSIDRID